MSNNGFYQYRYKFEATLLFGDGTTMVPKKIISVKETGNYHSDFMSIMEMEFYIARNDSMQIYKNQLNTTVHLIKTCYKYRTHNMDPVTLQATTDSGEMEDQLESQEKELDIIMIPIFKDGTFPTNLPEEQWENDNTSASLNPEDGSTTLLMDTVPIIINMVLYSQQALVTNKSANINAVLKNCLPATALAWMISEAGINKAIVDTPDNNYQEDFIILLPYNLRNSIHMLHNNYGLYKDSILAFMDFDTLYVLNKYGQAHDFESGDKPYTVISMHDPRQNQRALSILNETDNSYEFHINVDAKPSDQRTLAGELIGDQVIVTNLQMAINSIVSKNGSFVGYNPAAAAVKRQVDSHSSSGTKTRFEYDETNNLFLLSSFMREISSKEMMSIQILNSYSAAFKPNKIITLSYPQSTRKQQKYGGNYTLVESFTVYHLVKKTSGSEMMADTNIFVQTLAEDQTSTS